MLFDNILKEIGEFGWYQRRVYCLATLPSMLVAFEALSIIFIFYIPDHRCALPGFDSDTFEIQGINHSLLVNRTIPLTDGKFDQCHVYNNVSVDAVGLRVQVGDNDHNGSFDFNTPTTSRCERWVYDFSTFDSTIATDFDVVCQHSVHRASSNMIAELGTLAGNIVIGFIADRFGRKVPFYAGGLTLVAGGFGIAFTTNLINLNVCRFVLGIARTAVFLSGIVIGLEIVGPSKRAWAGLLIEFIWCTGEFLLLLIAYFVRNWRYLEIALSVPSIVLLFYWWLLPESPRWLSSRGRDAEALQILERIAKSNNVKMPQVDDASQLVKEEKQMPLRHAIKSKELLIRIFLVLCNLFVIVVVYYGLTLNISNLSGDIFINFAINVAFEFLGYGACLFLLDRAGRKPVQCGSMIMAGTVCTASFIPVIFDMPSWILVLLSMVGRFAVCMAFGAIYVYAAELFPTVVRSSAMGVGVTFARIGSIIAPFIADVGLLMGGRYKDALPLVLMGTPALLVGLLSLWLPETLNTTLPETLEDMEKAKMQRRCPCCKPSVQDEGVDGVDGENQETTQC